MDLKSRIPEGPLAEKWDKHRFEMKLVNPANKRKYTVIVVGTGLAGGSAAASLGELGYNVLNFCIQDSPRRAHSIAAQGGTGMNVRFTRGFTAAQALVALAIAAFLLMASPSAQRKRRTGTNLPPPPVLISDEIVTDCISCQ